MGLRRKFVAGILICFLSACFNRNRSDVSYLFSSPTYAQNCFPKDVSYGAAKGRLLLTNHQPAVGSILYLGEYIGLETSDPSVVLDPARHPRTHTDMNGEFCFYEIPPGIYGLIVWNAAESILLPDPKTGRSLILEIEHGKIIDVGTLYSPIP